jgi:hypothetical protein
MLLLACRWYLLAGCSVRWAGGASCPLLAIAHLQLECAWMPAWLTLSPSSTDSVILWFTCCLNVPNGSVTASYQLALVQLSPARCHALLQVMPITLTLQLYNDLWVIGWCLVVKSSNIRVNLVTLVFTKTEIVWYSLRWNCIVISYPFLSKYHSCIYLI